ncbi:MAG TPA: pseudouridine synthase [Thermoleophilia bacterium]|nr:pseudouridine synthase [Thermoleophilia bacterium]
MSDARDDQPTGREQGPADDQPKGREQPAAGDQPKGQEQRPAGDAPASPGRGRRRGGRGRDRGQRGGRGEGGRGEQRGRRGDGGERGGGGQRGGGGERGDGGEREEQRDEATLVTYLARSGVGSRRRCDEVIREGRVTVDGVAVTFPREKLGEQAEVAVDGEVVTPREYRYVLVNKPRGVASTRYDPHAERVLVDLVPDGRLLFPVGRLDVDTTGLIILTNDGVLANRLMHPRYGVSKTYSARVRGHAGKRALAELRAGIELEDGPTAPAEARVEKQSNRSTLVELTIHEGRKHQVRRMLAAVGLPVEELHRRRYGPLSDKNLKIGAWRGLSGDEVEALRRVSEEVERSLVGDDPGEAVELAGPATAPDADLAPEADEPSTRAETDEPSTPEAGVPPTDEPSTPEADVPPADEPTDEGHPV